LNNSADKLPPEPTESRRGDSDRDAIERGEDDGMNVPECVIPRVRESGRPDANTER